MRKVNLKFKRLICFFIAIILLFCFNKNNYLHQVKADNETHEFNISPVGKTYTISEKFDNNTYDIPANNYTLGLSNTSRNSPAEITDSKNEKYYLKINRYAAIISTNFDNIDDPTPTTKKVFANLYLDEKEEAGSEVVNLIYLVITAY